MCAHIYTYPHTPPNTQTVRFKKEKEEYIGGETVNAYQSLQSGVIAQALYPNTDQAEAGNLLIWGLPRLRIEALYEKPNQANKQTHNTYD